MVSLRHHLELYSRLLGAQLRSQMQYHVGFVLDLISTMFFTATEFGAFVLVFQRFPSIGGWKLEEVAFLYGMVEVSFGVMDMVFAGFDPPAFAQYIRKGTLDQFLLRPSSLLIQVFGSDFTLRRIGRIALAVGILVYAFNNNQIVWNLEKLLYFPFVILGMILFFGGMFMIGATITFWTVESTEAMNIFTYGGGYLMSYPMNIYSDWLRKIFTFVIPAIFLNYYPALFFLERPDPFGMPYFVHFLAPVVGFLVFFLSVQFWKFGLMHYQSTGN